MTDHPADSGAVTPRALESEQHESRSPDGDGHVGVNVADQITQRKPRAGLEPADSQPAPRSPDVPDLLAKLSAELRGSLFTTFNDYKDADTVRGRFEKACPYLSAYSIERMVEVFCDELDILRAALAAGHAPQEPVAFALEPE